MAKPALELPGPGEHHQRRGHRQQSGPGERRQAIVEEQADQGRKRDRALLEHRAQGEAGAPHRDQHRRGGEDLGGAGDGAGDPEPGAEVEAPPGCRHEGHEGEHQRERQPEEKPHQRRAPRPRAGHQRALQRIARHLQRRRADGDRDPQHRPRQAPLSSLPLVGRDRPRSGQGGGTLGLPPPRGEGQTAKRSGWGTAGPPSPSWGGTDREAVRVGDSGSVRKRQPRIER